MSTPLTDSINALTAYANEATGQSDTNLSDAVHTLASGYGGGGNVVTGTYTPSEDIYSNLVQIPHDLGAIPDFIICFADGITADPSYTVPYLAASACTKINATSPQTTQDYEGFILKTRQTYNQIQISSVNNDGTKFLNESWVKIPFYSTSDYLKAGVAYHYAFGLYS